MPSRVRHLNVSQLEGRESGAQWWSAPAVAHHYQNHRSELVRYHYLELYGGSFARRIRKIRQSMKTDNGLDSKDNDTYCTYT